MFRLVTVTIISAIFFAVTEASLFEGCATLASVQAMDSSSLYVLTTYQLTVSLCISTCVINSLTNAAYTQGLTKGANCRCFDESSSMWPAVSGYVAASSGVTCASGDVALYYGSNPTTETYSACYTTSAVTRTTTNYGTATTDPYACIKSCSAYTAAFFIPYTNSGSGFACLCSNQVTALSSTTTTCGPNTYFLYKNSVSTASAGAAVRRQLQDKKAKRQVLDVKSRGWDCPRGMTACNIKGSPGDWECIDTTSDLESCGGCAAGEYMNGFEETEATGEDCTAIPGIKQKALTCTRGRCHAFACQKGYELVEGTCVKSFNVQYNRFNRRNSV